MFTVEIKINGFMISHIYGHNESQQNKAGETRYTFEYYEIESRKLQTGEVWHKREDGIDKLIGKILSARKYD